MKSFVKFNLLLFTTLIVFGCASLQPPQTDYSGIYQFPETADAPCSPEEQARNPSAVLKCEKVYSLGATKKLTPSPAKPSSKPDVKPNPVKNEDPQLAKKYQEDPLISAEAKMNTADMPFGSGQTESPIRISQPAQRFRDRFLGYLRSPIYREPLTRSFESALRMKSYLAQKLFAKNGNYAQYDLVIVGAGVHGVIALHEALAQNPKLKVLLIDEGDTAGATFRYGKEVFNINSSNRRSDDVGKPLPGEGNINELPGLPIQVSDLTAVKYPTANDLGTSIVAGLYSAVREHPNVDVLFKTKATSFEATGKDRNFEESLMVVTENGKNTIQIDAQKIILTTGLGTPRVPGKVAENLRANPKLAQSQNGNPPRVVTFEDMIRMLAMSNNPAELFRDKKIGIVGTGDSANVLIEYFLGYAAREGYATSNAQSGQVQKIAWIGQAARTCEEFISDIRSRYQGIGTGFRSSSKNLEAIIKAYPPKLDSVKESGAKVDARLTEGQGVSGLDFIVLTTGFEQNVRSLFDKIVRNRAESDTALFESEFETINAKTTVSSGTTRVGRKLNDREIYVLGTAAGELAAKNELVGIIQNYVSIFNNAPRVVAATRMLTRGMRSQAKLTPLNQTAVGEVTKQQAFKITGIQETRVIPNQSLAYMEGAFREAVSLVQNGSRYDIDLVIQRQGNDLTVRSETKADVSELVQLLAESREFFSMVNELLKYAGGSIQFTAKSNGNTFDIANAKATYSKTAEKKLNETVEVANSRIQLRGLEKFSGKPQDRLSPQDYTKSQFFIAYKGGGKVVADRFTNRPFQETLNVPAFEISTVPISGKSFLKYIKEMYEEVPNEVFGNRVKDTNEPAALTASEGKFLLASINKFSGSTTARIQNLIKAMIPGHVKGNKYRFPNESEGRFFVEFIQEGGLASPSAKEEGVMSFDPTPERAYSTLEIIREEGNTKSYSMTSSRANLFFVKDGPSTSKGSLDFTDVKIKPLAMKAATSGDVAPFSITANPITKEAYGQFDSRYFVGNEPNAASYVTRKSVDDFIAQLNKTSKNGETYRLPTQDEIAYLVLSREYEDQLAGIVNGVVSSVHSQEGVLIIDSRNNIRFGGDDNAAPFYLVKEERGKVSVAPIKTTSGNVTPTIGFRKLGNKTVQSTSRVTGKLQDTIVFSPLMSTTPVSDAAYAKYYELAYGNVRAGSTKDAPAVFRNAQARQFVATLNDISRGGSTAANKEIASFIPSHQKGKTYRLAYEAEIRSLASEDGVKTKSNELGGETRFIFEGAVGLVLDIGGSKIKRITSDYGAVFIVQEN